ncbi:POP1-domain-containing protein [Lichtheimia hyalospora FSU 10163]|nr:POP1-domain-containing protein [Lichtheimia hyalospora FSU 10163]
MGDDDNGGNNKRRRENSPPKTGRDKRRAMQFSGRKIGQPSRSEFRNTLGQNAPNVGGAITPEDYMTARLEEIRTMQSAIKSASNTLTCLTAQGLPRDMRRRAASHDLNRLPAHLRARAALEREDGPPNPRRKKKGKRKAKADNVLQEYLRRQKENKWLGTHMWHTKRMKMNNIWGYRLARKPNIKSARSIYRAFQHTTVIHDASYMGCLEMEGSFHDIVALMNHITDVSLPSVASERFNQGNRMGHTFLYEYTGCPSQCICPITYLWMPSDDLDGRRKIWIWIHPSAFAEAYASIQAAHTALSKDITITDQCDQLALFELSGASSTALMQTILKPVEENGHVCKENSPTSKAAQVWRDLRCLRSSSTLPSGVVIGLTVQDPRLEFPQKPAPKTNIIPVEKETRLGEILSQWPKDISRSTIWDSDIRSEIQSSMPGEHTLNKRREKNLLPGTKLEFTEIDVKMPILLVQRGSSESVSHGRQTTCTTELMSGWNIIMPKACALPLWKSFMFAGARAAGYEDVHAMHFESKRPNFPHDYIGTKACDNMLTMAKNDAESAWRRRPPAKRFNYEKFGVTRPFDPPFDVLTHSTRNEALSQPSYYTLYGEKIISLVLSATTDDQAQVQARDYFINMFAKRGITMQLNALELSHALLQIRIEYLDRGRPEANAMIYLIDNDAEYNHISSSYLSNRQSKGKKTRNLYSESEDEKESDTDDMELDKIEAKFPPNDDCIGYLTTASFSFNEGCGSGLGACTVAGIRRLQAMDQRLSSKEHQERGFNPKS